MSHNAKYYIKSFKIKWNLLVSEGCERKNIQKKNCVDTLADTATVNFACVSSSSQSKKDSAIEVDKLIVFFSLYYIAQLNTVFLKFVLVKRKFAWIAKKLTSIGSFKAMISWFCLAVAHTSVFDPPRQTFLLENQHMKPFVWFFLCQLSFFIHLLI